MFNLLMFRQSPVLYLTRELGVQPATIGLIYALGGVGGLLGAVAAERAQWLYWDGSHHRHIAVVSRFVFNGLTDGRFVGG